MMRPVILSSPEKLAFLLVILVRRRLGDHLVARLQARGRLRHALGLALSRRQSRPSAARWRRLDLRARPAAAAATAMPGWVFCGTTVVPGGGASGCDCTAPGRRARPAPAADGSASAAGGRAAAPALPRHRRAVCCGWLPRGIAPGGRSGGSEKILPICARAGGASEIVEAATRAAKPVRAMVRNISRGFKRRIGLAT